MENMEDMEIILLLIKILSFGIILCSVGFLYVYRDLTFWKRQGVIQKDVISILWDNLNLTLKRKSMVDVVMSDYNFAPNARYIGTYHMLQPMLSLRDPDLIKQITIRDSNNFPNHVSLFLGDIDPLWSKGLFALRNEKWKTTRSTLSPAFTSNKMKLMFPVIEETAQQFVAYFLQQDKDLISLELKDAYARYTNDVMANTVFSIKTNSLEERNNEFYLMGKEVALAFWANLKILLILLLIRFPKKFLLTVYPRKASMFFKKKVEENIKARNENRLEKPDMIQLFLEVSKNVENEKTDASESIASSKESDLDSKPIKEQLSLDDITAQALLFFFGGFDSVSFLISFMSHELAINPTIQDKLYQELLTVLENDNSKITYNSLMEMKYLDMVMNESLRKWPNAIGIDRECNEPYTIEPQTPDEKPVHLAKKSLIWVPIVALHRDPKYYPEPDRFDPERFRIPNKGPTFIPFGNGPRYCIGNRFTLLVAKTLMCHVLTHFEFVPVERTQIPLKMCKKRFNLVPEDGFWVGLKKRTLAD